jgi:hypothetical protein
MQRTIAAGEARGLSRFRALVEGYLSERHLKSPESGCPVAALASEMPAPARGRARGRGDAGEVAARHRRGDPACGQPEGAAAAVAGQLVGALQLARALGDNARGRRHLADARRFLLEQFDPHPLPAADRARASRFLSTRPQI